MIDSTLLYGRTHRGVRGLDLLIGDAEPLTSKIDREQARPKGQGDTQSPSYSKRVRGWYRCAWLGLDAIFADC